MKRILTLAATTLLLPAALAAQIPVTEGSVDLGITGTGQIQFNTTTVGAEPTATFEQRRIRLGAVVNVDDWIDGKLEADFAMGSLAVTDAWIDLGFHPAFALRGGQFKKPFSSVYLTSATKLVPIERGTRIRGVGDPVDEYSLLAANGYLGRDIGAEIHGDLGPLAYAIGAFNGEGPNARDANDDKSFAGRLELTPSATLPLVLAGAASWSETPSTVVADSTLDGLAWEGDVTWGAFRVAGPMLAVEVSGGSNLAVDAQMLAAQGFVSWFFPTGRTRIEGVEPLVRAGWADPNTDVEDDTGILLTPGLNLYFFGRNRLMLNWDLYSAGAKKDFFDDATGAHAVRVQMQLAF